MLAPLLPSPGLVTAVLQTAKRFLREELAQGIAASRHGRGLPQQF
jgi:hypothetical protein